MKQQIAMNARGNFFIISNKKKKLTKEEWKPSAAQMELHRFSSPFSKQHLIEDFNYDYIN